ncbi:hypothetical protein OE88DRAFT_1528494 [Heliocybe sulcata]|uniref:DUF6533 domain-containing protein n=1 Tax=Heliocybe sulcata TaxID=5364 RepID=A0A5C3NBP0_9AGAM|nr:hypothetical protein OE88DRAFT_1528494 [Heliocybe sulcata]
MASTAIQEAIDTLVTVEFTRYSYCAAIAIYLHHFSSTVIPEVEVIWKLPSSPMKILYLINRYYGLAFVVSATVLLFLQTQDNISCNMMSRFLFPSLGVSVLIVQVILAIRAYAIFGGRKWHIIVIVVLLALEIGFTTALITLHSQSIAVTFRSVAYCVNLSQWSFVPALVTDALMASAIVYRAILHVRSRHAVDLPASWGYGGPLLVTLLQDSVQYYVWVIVALALTTASGKPQETPKPHGLSILPFIMTVPTSAVTHMVLHLHRVASAGRRRPVAVELELVSIPTDGH